MQIGDTWTALHDQTGTLRIGFAGTSGNLWMTPDAIDGPSKASFNTETAAGLVSYQHNSGWHVDAIAAGGAFGGTVSTAARGETTGLSGTAWRPQSRRGTHSHCPPASLEPQAQFIYQHLYFTNRTDADGIPVDIGGQDQIIGRFGARLARPIDMADGARVTPYAKVNLLQSIGSTGNALVGGTAFGIGNYGTAMQLGGGVSGNLTRSVTLYADVDWQRSVGGGGGVGGWAFSGGLRILLGG